MIWDFLPLWIDKYNEITSSEVKPEDIKSWDIKQYIPEKHYNILFSILDLPYIWKDIKLKEGAYEVLKALSTHPNVELYIVTATSHRNAASKINRLLELCPFIDSDNIILIKHKQLLELDILIDDNPRNLYDGKYIKVLFECCHNQDVKKHTSDFAPRINFFVSNWSEVEELLNKLINY